MHRNELQQVGQADGEQEAEVNVQVPVVAHAVEESGMNTVQCRTLQCSTVHSFKLKKKKTTTPTTRFVIGNLPKRKRGKKKKRSLYCIVMNCSRSARPMAKTRRKSMYGYPVSPTLSERVA